LSSLRPANLKVEDASSDFRTVNEMFLCDLDGYTARIGRKAT
jgi:hypothetical protein